MAKYYGTIGYGKSVETSPGVWRDEITERKYYGELIRNTRRLESSDKLVSDINIANDISIVADQFANENFYAMRYIEFMGAKWKISNVEVKPPRLILTIGGLYNA